MRYLIYLYITILCILAVIPNNLIGQSRDKELSNKTQYLNAAIEMGDYLIRVQDKVTKSWHMPWNKEATDAIASFYAIGALNKLSVITNDKKYFNAAIESISWWLENMFLGEKSKCLEWNWLINDRVTKARSWDENEWDKCEGAFLSQYYTSKDGYPSVRAGTIHTRDGATLGVDLIKKLPNTDRIIESMRKWFQSDLDNKATYSGDTNFRGFLTLQSIIENGGKLEVSREYSLWGSRQQSALVNAKMIPDLIELGLLKQAEERAEWLLEVMKNRITGSFYEMFDLDKGIQSVGYKSNFTFATGQVIEGLLVAYEYTKNRNYLESALDALKWLINTQAIIDNKIVYFTEDKVYRTFAAVPALCKAYRITGNNDYLIYARSAGDWIISQMKDPFEGFEDNNAWTAAEGLEALVNICEILQ
ncbi:MAG TPA: glycoside hydrolase family 127 protein [Ignavibacteriaceae bacterium]|nr:glycoside hydrolase family 127 protein [Ignavibacteriaceae bacterium]